MSPFPIFREKADGASLFGKDVQPLLELQTKFTVSFAGFSRYRDMALFCCAGKRGLYPNLGGTADLLFVRPKPIFCRFRAFLLLKSGGAFDEIGKTGGGSFSGKAVGLRG